MSQSNVNNTCEWNLKSGAMRALQAVALLCACAQYAAAEDNRAPEVPFQIEVPSTNKVHFHGYAEGFQIYTWNGTDWGAAVPDARLYDNDGNFVIKHSAGPTWESTSGSKVVGALPPAKVIVDDTAIPWLRLNAAIAEGPGILEGTTYIHRVNTVGGLPPRPAGAFVGEVATIPYTATYFFYRPSTK